MTGPADQDENRGVIQRTIEYIFELQQKAAEEGQGNQSVEFLNKVSSYVEIYNEQVFDLLNPDAPPCVLREDLKRGGIYVHGATEEVINNPTDAQRILDIGLGNRTTAATAMNRCSSRSHSILTLTIQSKTTLNGITSVKDSRINLVDLAGSERQTSSSTVGLRLKEGSHINKSLLTLGKVIDALADIAHGKPRHIPYRDSKLTMLLRDSIGGNARCAMIANVSQSMTCVGETLSTLRAKLVKNKAHLNQSFEAADLALLKDEISRLQTELAAYREGKAAVATNKFAEHPFDASLLRGLNDRNAQLEQEIVAQQKIIETLNQASQKKSNQLHHAQMIVRLKDDQISRLRNGAENVELEVLKAEIAQLRASSDQSPAALEYAAQVLQLQQELNGLRYMKETMTNERQRIVQMEQDWISKLSELETYHEGVRQDLESFRNGDAFRELNALYSEATDKVAKLTCKYQAVEDELARVQDSESQCKSELEMALKHIDELESEMDKKASYFIGQAEQIHGLKDKLSLLESNLKEKEEVSVKKEKKLEQKIKELEANLVESNNERDHLSTKEADYLRIIEDFRKEQQETFTQHEALRTQYENAVSELKVLITSKASSDELLANKEEEMKQMREKMQQVDAFEAEAASAKAELEKVSRQLEVALQDKKYLESSFHEIEAGYKQQAKLREVELVQEMQEMQKIISEEKKKLEKSSAEHEIKVKGLLDTVSQLKAAVLQQETQVAEFDRINGDNEALVLLITNQKKLKLSQSEAELSRIHQALKDEKDARMVLQTSFESIQSKYETLKMEYSIIQDDLESMAQAKYSTEGSLGGSKEAEKTALIESLKRRISELEATENGNSKALKDELDRTKAEFEAQKARISQLEKTLADSEYEAKMKMYLEEIKEREAKMIEEKDHLVSQVEQDIAKLKAENEKLMQHSNHKQKLQYMVQLKRENNNLKQEIRALHAQLEKGRDPEERLRKHEKLDISLLEKENVN